MRSTPPSDSVTYSTMRKELAAHLRRCAKFGERFTIMRNGRAEGVLVGVAEWEQLLQTLEILTNPALMKQIVRSEKDIKAGRVQELSAAFEDILGEA